VLALIGGSTDTDDPQPSNRRTRTVQTATAVELLAVVPAAGRADTPTPTTPALGIAPTDTPSHPTVPPSPRPEDVSTATLAPPTATMLPAEPALVEAQVTDITDGDTIVVLIAG
jgi:hypothetical protein